MRICWVTTSFPRFVGDHSATFLLTLAKHLVRKGVDLTIVAPHEGGLPEEETLEGVRVCRFVYWLPRRSQALAYGHGIPDNIRRNPSVGLQVPPFLASAALKVLSMARGADVLHGFWTPSAFLAVPAKKRYGIPLVTTLLGSDIRGGPKTVNRIALHFSDAVVCATEEMAAYLRTYPVKVPVFDVKQTNLVDPDRLRSGDSLEPDLLEWIGKGSALITLVARLVDFKDPVGFVHAMPYILQEHPGTRFLIIGDGPLFEPLETLIRSMNLTSCARLTGHRTDIGSFLERSTVFVANSPVSNCYSCAVLEAMSAGVPCVLTDAGDPRGTFRGYVELARPRDPRSLAQAVNTLLSDEEQRRHRAATSRQFLLDLGFGSEVVLRQTMEIYEALRRDPKLPDRLSIPRVDLSPGI